MKIKNIITTLLLLLITPAFFGQTSCPSLTGLIKIQNAARYCSGVKLDFFFDPSPNSPAINSYTWTFYDLDGSTVLQTYNNVPGLISTFNYPNNSNGDYLVNVEVNYGNNCTAIFQRLIAVSDCDTPCDKADIPENYLIDLFQHIITQLQAGVSPANINGTSPLALLNLTPYITDNDANGVINNFTVSQEGYFYFSFSPNHSNDIIFNATVDTINNLDITGMDLDFIDYQGSQDYTSFVDFITPSGNSIKLIRVRHINFCSETTDNKDNEFCVSEMEEYPTVADLLPNNPNVVWYTTETGGTPLDSDEPLINDSTGTIYWWDDTADLITIRTQAIVIVYGMTQQEEENEYQVFSQGANATVANLLPVGAIWYDNFTYNTPLNPTTPLINGATYYGELSGVLCKFNVEVFIGTNPPEGNSVQYLCVGQTIQDILIELQDTQSSATWYLTESGGTPISTSTVLTNYATYYVAQIDSNGFESTERLEITVILSAPIQPEVPNSTQIFDIDQTPPPTVANLIAFGYDIKWYPQEVGGNVYATSEALEHGVTYWAEQNIGPCPSTRVPVLVQIIEIPEPPLLGCEEFKPQPGDRYIINAWVREQGVIPINPQEIQFNNSEESALFVDLLNHLVYVVQHYESDIHDITVDGYIPISETENLDFDPLIPFVKEIGTEIKLKVYDFERIEDNYGGTVQGGRTIGFRFKLSSNPTAPTFEWLSPQITVVKYGESYTYRYPINDNPSLELEFTNVQIQGGNIVMSYTFDTTSLTPNLTGTVFNHTSISGLEESITEYDYEEVPDFQPMDYIETLVELEYRDAEQNMLPIDPETLKFEPKGEIIDGWQRVYADFEIPGNAAQMTISLKNNSATSLAYFDDIRMQPYHSNMKTFVYHPETQRLMSELDENNYATFYEYDAEGGLVRVKKETEKGVYTIQETRSSTAKQTN
jgi:hypothetical protein